MDTNAAGSASSLGRGWQARPVRQPGGAAGNPTPQDAWLPPEPRGRRRRGKRGRSRITPLKTAPSSGHEEAHNNETADPRQQPPIPGKWRFQGRAKGRSGRTPPVPPVREEAVAKDL